MPLPELPGVVRASVGGSIVGGGRWSNTWHFRRIDLGPADELLIGTLHVALMAFYAGPVFGNMAAGSTLEAANYTPLDGSSGAFVFPGGLSSAAGSSPLPPECAEVLTIRSALRGRRHRGRVFLPAMSAAEITAGGRISNAIVTEVLAGMVTLRAALAVIGWELGVASYGVSRKVDHTVTPARVVLVTWAPEFTPATTVTMDDKVDVIRSRKA